MISWRPLATALLAFCVAACAPLDRRADVGADAGLNAGLSGVNAGVNARVSDSAAQSQLLVMLRLAPPHFRPDVDYAGSYDSRVGRDARLRMADALAQRYGLRIVDDWPMPALGVDCYVMSASSKALGDAAGKASLDQIVEALSRDPSVESAQSMNLFHVLAYNDPLYPLQPSARLWHLADLHNVATGRNVRIAELDTGVEADHPDLKGRVAVMRNFVDDRGDVAEQHGTAVAGIIAANANNGVGIVGIAPEAKLVALRACWEAADRSYAAVCNSFTLAKALQFALTADVQVINLSLGGPNDRLLGRLLDTALSRGISVVAAADPRISDGGFPASHRGVLAIAGDDRQDVSASMLRGPGRDIPTTMVDGKWTFVTGSSFAAAHVTGLVALLRELSPNLQPQQIRDLLAPPATSGATADTGAIVDACAVIGRTTGACACACAVAHDTKSPPRL